MRKYLAVPMILFLLLGFLVSPVQAKKTEKQIKMDKINSLMPYMKGIVKQRGASFQLDLADVKQYEFVLARLDYFGKTKKNSPQLYASLKRIKEKHSALKKIGQPISQTVTTLTTLNDDHHHSIAGLTPRVVTNLENPNLVKGEIVSTVKDGNDVTYIDIVMRDESGTSQLGNPAFFEDYGDGTDARIAAVADSDWVIAQFPDDVAVTMDSMQYTAKGDDEQVNYLFERSARPASNQEAVIDNYVRDEPRDINADGKIMLCLNRVHADCDYPMDQNLPNHDTYVSIPFKGSVTIDRKIVEIYPSTQQLTAFGHNTGMYVYAQGLGGATALAGFSDYVRFDVDEPNQTSTISWDVPRDKGTFQNAPLYARYENVDWFFKINMKVKGSWSPWAREADVQLSASTGDNDDVYVMEPDLPPLEFAYSCIAEGTQIRLADGTLMPIEKIANGMNIKANGADLSVIDTSVGIETIPMVRIIDQKGNNVLLTESHPVLTVNQGIIWASEVKKGDRVKNEDGTSIVTSVTTEMFGGKVYNVKLDVSHIQADQKAQVNAIYANDILVGDLDMQAEFEFKNKEKRKDVLSRLPEQWHQDYLNSLNR